MNQNIQALITQLLQEESAEIEIGKIIYFIADATNENATQKFLADQFDAEVFLLIPEKIWLLKYMANPPIDMYFWDGKALPFDKNSFVQLADNFTREQISVIELKTEFGYALLKRFRKPLFAIRKH